MSRFGKITSDKLTDMSAVRQVELRASVNTTLINGWNAAVEYAGLNVISFPYPVKILHAHVLITTVLGAATHTLGIGITGAANAIVTAAALATVTAGVSYNLTLTTAGYSLPAHTPIIVTTATATTGVFRLFMGYKINIETDKVT